MKRLRRFKERNNKMISPIKFAFFGSSRFSVIVLDELAKLGFKPELIVTTPDKPVGRKLVMTPNIVKTWGLNNSIKVIDPVSLKTANDQIRELSNAEQIDLFVVASYGKIIPKSIIEIPKWKTLNIHPSLLPKYRGASPLQSAILNDDKDTGVSIMQIDEEMDHGPIIAQESVHIEEWLNYKDFEEIMAKAGANLLVKTIPLWVSGKIVVKEQDHDNATYTKKIQKSDGEIPSSIISKTESESAFRNAFLKIQAFHEWPIAYFMIKHNGKSLRIKITQASWNNSNETGKLQIEKVIPEGSKEMSWDDFKRGYKIS